MRVIILELKLVQLVWNFMLIKIILGMRRLVQLFK